jgi:hypothetical protein
MRKQKRAVSVGVKCGKLDEACKRYGLGRSAMRETARTAGAIVHIGRSLLIDFETMDGYINTLKGAENG